MTAVHIPLFGSLERFTSLTVDAVAITWNALLFFVNSLLCQTDLMPAI
jgi:hypothetical protein